jgi:prepilin-type processing-associated H-X9-DG protein
VWEQKDSFININGSGDYRTNHLRDFTDPAGGNILFLDGHVTWTAFNAMEIQYVVSDRGGTLHYW